MNFPLPAFARSLRGRVVLLTAATSLATALLVGGIGDYRSRHAATDAAMAALANEARLTALQFESRFAALRTNALMVSRMQPIRGLMRALRNGGVDPLDGSTTDQWRDRLETIFRSVMAEAPQYTQMRYVGAAENGRELLRVERKGSTLVSAAPAEMLEIGDEPYVAEGLELGRDEVLFSTTTRNRESGRIEPLSRPTLRAVVSIEAAGGEIFGLIVINVDYENFIRRSFEIIAPKNGTYFISNSGDFVAYKPGAGIGDLELYYERLGSRPVYLSSLTEFGSGRAAVPDDGFAAYRVDSVVSPRGEGAKFSVVLRVSRDQLLAGANETRRETLFLILASAFVSIAVAVVCAKRLVAPLETIGRRLSAHRIGGGAIGLPVDRTDEIGVLSRAFEAYAAALVQSETKAEAIIECAMDGILMIDETGLIVSYNAACERMFGYDFDAMVGRSVNLLMPEADRAAHDGHLRRYMASGEKQVIGVPREMRGRRKNGETFPFEITIAETQVNGRRFFTGIVRDISDRLAREAENMRLIAKLEESNAELESFAYVASHDLKAPLRAIDSTASWLAEDLEAVLTGENLENMEFLRGRVRRMDKLLDDLLEYSRIGRKLDRQYSERVDGAGLLQDVLALLPKPPRFDISVSPLFADVMLERMPLQQIFHNLISNAIKHHDREEGTIDVAVEDLGAAYAFIVKDDGPGIPAAFHDQIFNMFQTLKPRDQVEGSGMGLAVVKKHVRQRNGSVELASSEGAGSAFRVVWPKESVIITE